MNQDNDSRIVVSSEDVISAYQEKVAELIHENALLKARILRMDRESKKDLPRPLGTREGIAEGSAM